MRLETIICQLFMPEVEHLSSATINYFLAYKTILNGKYLVNCQ